MSSTGYLTKPDQNEKKWPKGVPYIVGNEGCERFSYYGMNAILYVYIVSLYAGIYSDETASGNHATYVVHMFKTGVYAMPMIGAIIADRFLGKYNTILWLSIVYCFGHLVLSLTEGSIFGLYAGLFLIALGSGGIKPCVSAHVGDQFGRGNWHLTQKIYQIFYFIINFGSFFAVAFIPLIKEWYGWSVAFAIPGVLMLGATILFWMGREKFVHIPAKPGGRLGMLDTVSSVLMFMTVGSLFFTATWPAWQMLTISVACMTSGVAIFQYRQQIEADDGFMAVSIFYMKEWLFGEAPQAVATTGSGQIKMKAAGFKGQYISQKMTSHFGEEAVEATKAVLRIMSIFILVSVFWALFDQHGSSWIRQATMMNRDAWLPFVGDFTLLPSQIPSLNPVMVMMLIPVMTYGVWPFFEKLGYKPTALKKMTLGMGIASIAFVSVALLQTQIDSSPEGAAGISVLWQLIPYWLITLAEVLVSITGLEFAYTQAPKRMKSTIMGFWLLTVALGNVMVAMLAKFGDLELVEFFWTFAFLMAFAAVFFGIRSKYYKTQDCPQE